MKLIGATIPTNQSRKECIGKSRLGMVMKRAAIYLRVSTDSQTTDNQEIALRETAERMNWDIVRVYSDHGISGATGRDKRPQFDALCKAATRREFDLVMAWSWIAWGEACRI
jgi:DNA invertase Pin-like site-specific DNA recombinase